MLPLNKLLTTLLTVAALSIAITAAAKPCGLTTSQSVALPGGMYVVHDLCQPDCLFSVLVYEETNGVSGLQRGDHRVDDTCGGTAGISDSLVL